LDEVIRSLKQALKRADRVAVLTGAGISAITYNLAHKALVDLERRIGWE